ncbi:MAG TPA: fasciclin domain-containing protein, partial [Chitinophagaceae bacterium]|nr:fasciclin domain-containing protein [Chitinophagaceae bacterium]
MKKLITRSALLVAACAILFASCKKEVSTGIAVTQNEEEKLKAEAQNAVSARQSDAADFEKEFALYRDNITESGQQNIVQIAQSLPIFRSLVAAVVKTGLAGTLSSASLNATVFAPTDAAFAKLPAPFNNQTNINNITDPAQIDALRNILLYHVLGSEVRRNQVPGGRSSAATLKPEVISNDNKIYFSNNLGLLLVNGNSLVLLANVDASNGIIHVIDDVLLPPTQTIAG